MGKRLKLSLLLCFCIIFAFSSTGLLIFSIPSSGWASWTSPGFYSVRIGHVSAGIVISGSYSSDTNKGFFIVDGGNHSRWAASFSYDSYSDRFGTHESFYFIVPYDDTWYAVFSNPYWDLNYVRYEIHVGLSPSVQTLLFAILGIGLVGISGMLILLKVGVPQTKLL